MDNKYEFIFQQGSIGGLVAKNRVKYAATETNFNCSDGYVTDREVAYMEAQAKGGAGIVTTQGAYPDLKGEGKGFRGMMAISEDRFIPGLARLADVIRQNGALSCIQILHCGREGGVDLDYSLMPTVVPQKLSYFKPPREITIAEIKQSVIDHVAASRRAKEAGYDMIELSGIVGYLMSTFISSYTNKRKDDWGGDIRARSRLMFEIVQAVKAEVGSMPVGIRLCGLELLEDRGGNTMEESMETFRIAQEAGADYVSVTVGWHESSKSVITRDVPMGHWLWVAKKVKEYVSIPVMMAFRQFLPAIPDQAIKDGTIDFWEACRPMIADPQMPIKAREGREDEIVPCIACNICFSRLYYHQPIMCSVRPNLGYEGVPSWGYYGFEKSPEKKRIAVVGAGPAGLQYAAVAAEKGHDVTILERHDRTGGSVLMASQVDAGAVELLRPVKKLEGDCRRLGVSMKFGVQDTESALKALAPDLVVMATGARFLPVDVPQGIPLVTPEDIMVKNIPVPKKVIIFGGQGAGLGLAVHLLGKADVDITIVEESGTIGRDVNPFYLWQYMGLMRKKKVTILRNARFSGIRNGMFAVMTGDGEKTFDCELAVTALRAPSDMKDKPGAYAGKRIYIGDAKHPRRLNNAIHDGFRYAMEV